LVVYTFKINGEIRRIEIMSRMADEVASPQLRAWLEDGDLEVMQEIMGGPQEQTVEVPETEAIEYAYDRRGIRFAVYEGQNSIRFSFLLPE
jgi:hypothetical protein